LTSDTSSLLINGIAASTNGHSHPFNSITSSPTTLAGYGITDAISTDVVKTTSPNTNNSITTITIPELTTPLLASKVYNFKYYIRYQSVATGTGLKIGIAISSSAIISAQVSIPVKSTSTSGMMFGSITASGTTITSTGVNAADTPYIATIEGIIQMGSSAGSLNVIFGSEVSGNTITVLPYSIGVIEVIQ
jgi:hypothetical protein